MLTLGVLAAIVAVTMILTNIVGTNYGATLQERAQYVSNNANDYEVTGWILLYSDVLLAAGAFFLATRALDGRFAGSAFWILIGLSQVIYIVVHAVRTGWLIPVARDAANNATLYDATANFTRVLGTMAAIALVAGAVGVFWGEARAANAAIPSWLSYAAVGAAVVRLASIGLGYVDNEGAFYTSRVLFYVGFYLLSAAVLFLGARLGWPNMALAGSTATRSERA